MRPRPGRPAPQDGGGTRVLLVTNNLRWEGMEAQIASLAKAFHGAPHFVLHAAVFRPGTLVEVLEGMAVPVRVIPVRWPAGFTAVWRLARLMRSWQIDVLHSHGYKANVLAALAAQVAGVRAVVRTEHGLPEPFRGFRRAKMALYLRLDALAGRYLTDAIVAVSDDVAAYARGRFPAVPAFPVHNGIDADPPPRRPKAEARRALGLPPGGHLVGSIGRLVPVKDHATLLRAARRIAAETQRTQFVIAGKGPLQGALEAEAATLGIRDRVHVRYLPRGAQPLLDALDVLVFSSRHEGIPYALLEALRAQVPVVATAVGGLAEVLTDGRDGLLVPAGDPEALAIAVLRLLRDPGLARALGQRGRQTVGRRFSLHHMREQMEAVYEYVAGRREARGGREITPRGRSLRAFGELAGDRGPGALGPSRRVEPSNVRTRFGPS